MICLWQSNVSKRRGVDKTSEYAKVVNLNENGTFLTIYQSIRVTNVKFKLGASFDYSICHVLFENCSLVYSVYNHLQFGSKLDNLRVQEIPVVGIVHDSLLSGASIGRYYRVCRKTHRQNA